MQQSWPAWFPRDDAIRVGRSSLKGIALESTGILVFIVDDEPMIIKNLRLALEKSGYAVTTASSGDEAMVLIETKACDFRALVTDVDLPGKVTGWEVAHRARELNPVLPVVYMTGAAAHEWSANGVPESVLLTKPFALVQMVTAVAQLMNAASNLKPFLNSG
jgi:CheY-like chemotaxis protein